MGGRPRLAAASRPIASDNSAFAGPVRHVYVHVPFCRAKCDYCDFASVAMGDIRVGGTGVRAALPGTARPDVDRLFDRFGEGIAAEWEMERAAHDVRRIRTLYFGGGTPSLLGPHRLERLLELFRPHLTPKAEVTVEANPEDVDDAFATWVAAALIAGGAGAARGLRISLGVQSFVPALRVALGRRSQADPAAAFARLRAAGVGNLSVDLIHGIPGQTLVSLDADLAAVLDLSPDHLSWYELTLTPDTRPARTETTSARGERRCDVGQGVGSGVGRGVRSAHDADDTGAELYRSIVRTLSRAGYDWYEVSNFARPGRRARHNLAYWRARPYLGLGPGAVSTVGARRWENEADPEAWSVALRAGESPPREYEALDADTRARERLLLAARWGGSVPVGELAAAVDLSAATPLAAAGLVSLHSGTLRVTRKGRHVANEVCVRLFRDTRLRG